jgi:hypothetical protein
MIEGTVPVEVTPANAVDESDVDSLGLLARTDSFEHDVSPSSRPSATSRSRRRMILPLRVFGSSGARRGAHVAGRSVEVFMADQCVG